VRGNSIPYGYELRFPHQLIAVSLATSFMLGKDIFFWACGQDYQMKHEVPEEWLQQ
jgi:hypothetical protein